MASPPSPSSSAGSGSQFCQEPDLPQLVNYFVAAKRSILSTSHLLRANEIVNAARGLLEENTVLAAKNSYIHITVEGQISTLEALRTGIFAVQEESGDEFKSLLRTLDSADIRLQATLAKLRSTSISSTLRTSEKRALFDFIDFTSYKKLHSDLRACIDRFNEAKNELGHDIETFDGSMRSLRDPLAHLQSGTTQSELVSPLPPIFRDLEGRASEMAQNVQSLVQHYDLCVTALKHTEGGLPAASEVTGDVPKAPGVSVESLHQDAPFAPMTSSERRDMLHVVVKDADEVEEVVVEMREHAAEMEEQLENMLSHTALLRDSHDTLLSTLRSLEAVGKDIRPYITSARTFLDVWHEERGKIEQGIDDLESIKEFYDGFLEAYDGVITELNRRKKAEEEMERIAAQTEEKFAKLYEEDLAARRDFQDTHKDYIPLDLWPGVVDMPPKYRIIIAPEEREAEELLVAQDTTTEVQSSTKKDDQK